MKNRDPSVNRGACVLCCVVLLAVTGCASMQPLVTSGVEGAETLRAASGSIDLFEDVTINGCTERILVQSDDVEHNPILLFLHGGPGSSEMLWAHEYEEKLRRNFIFVNWDQRGAGYSYHDGIDPRTVSEAQIYQDALALIRYLTRTFRRDRIFLVGHSFGSVIGLQLAADHPELLYAYIGLGQVIDYGRSVRITYDWLHATLEKAGDRDGLRRIEEDRFPYIDLVIKYGGHHGPSIDLDDIMKGSPYYRDGYLERLQEGKDFSAVNVGRNRSLRTVARNSVYDIRIPLYFFEGVNDHVIACAPQLVVEFCTKVKAPVKKVIWFEHSAHLVNVEEPGRFQDELVRIKAETGM